MVMNELQIPPDIRNLQTALPVLEKQTTEYVKQRAQLSQQITDGARLGKELHIPYIKMPVPNIPWQEMLNEALPLEKYFVTHRSDDSSGWKSLSLHGINSSSTRAPEDYGYKSEKEVPYVWTEVTKMCPITMSWLKKILDDDWFSELYRVRFMWLEPGGYIKFHQDRKEGEHSLGPMNVALNMPENCFWLFKKWGRVPFTNGTAFAVDVSFQHGVCNLSSEPRVHLIIHGKYGRSYYNGIKSSYEELLRNV